MSDFDWRESEPPKDGSWIAVRVHRTYRWKAYSSKSEQFRKHGLKGRWQKMNDYGGWENAAPLDVCDWSPMPAAPSGDAK